jgi:hypothetical protein
MKKQLNEEFRRMQKLAGIITENEEKINEIALASALGLSFLISGAIMKFKDLKQNAEKVWKRMDQEERLSKDIKAAEDAKNALNTNLKGEFEKIQSDKEIAELIKKYNDSYNKSYADWFSRTQGYPNTATGEDASWVMGDTGILKQIEEKIKEKFGDKVLNAIKTSGSSLAIKIKNN